MAKRSVKTIDAALARTNKPITKDGLQNVVAGMGTERDKRAYSNWSVPYTLVRSDLENMYRGSWLAKRIVNSVADDMTREWLSVIFETADAAATQKKVDQAEKKFSIRHKVNEALRWARLYGGSVMIIGTEDLRADKSNLNKPLKTESIKPGGLKWLHVLDRWRVAPSGDVNRDLTSPNFGLPESYILAESSVLIHHTRVLRFDGQRLPYFSFLGNGMWHDSELQHVRDSLLNCDTASQSIATLLFESNVDVITSEGLSEALSVDGGDARVTQRFQLASLMKSFNRTLLLDGTEKYEKKTNTFANLDKVWENFMMDVCGAAEIPMTRLFGRSPAGLNATGESDLQNYYDMVTAKQNSDLREPLECLYEILLRSELGSFPEDFTLDFKPLWQMNEKDKATVEKTRAERDKIYLELGVVTEGTVAKELHENGTYSTMTDEDVALAEELAEMSKEAREVGHEAMKNGLENPDEGPEGTEGNPPKDEEVQ